MRVRVQTHASVVGSRRTMICSVRCVRLIRARSELDLTAVDRCMGPINWVGHCDGPRRRYVRHPQEPTMLSTTMRTERCKTTRRERRVDAVIAATPRSKRLLSCSAAQLLTLATRCLRATLISGEEPLRTLNARGQFRSSSDWYARRATHALASAELNAGRIVRSHRSSRSSFGR